MQWLQGGSEWLEAILFPNTPFLPDSWNFNHRGDRKEGNAKRNSKGKKPRR